MARGPKIPFRQRLETSRAVFREAWRMLKAHKDLRTFAYISMGVTLLPIMLFLSAVRLYDMATGNHTLTDPDEPWRPLLWGPLLLVLMYPGALLAAVANGAMIYGLYQRMAGRTCTRAQAWAASRTRLGALARFNLIAMLVAGILQFIGVLLAKLRIVPWIGGLLETVGVLGWATASYFVFPIIVIERESSAVAALRRSTSLARDHWGKSVSGIVTISLAAIVPIAVAGLIVMGLVIALAIVLLAMNLVPLLIPVTIVLLSGYMLVAIGSAAVSAAVGVAYLTALYRHATAGKIAAPFTVATVVDPWKAYQR